jgi:hypothetical protein
MKKVITFIALLLVCTLGYADSLQRLINTYKEKDGVRCKVFNRDSNFNDVPDDAFSPLSMKLRSGTLKVMGIEEMVVLQLDSCCESICRQFVEDVFDAIPTDYSLLSDKNHYRIYMSNSDEEYAYMLIVNGRLPGLTLMYVTNGFIRALVNDEGNGVDSEKLGRYLEQRAEQFGETMHEVGEKVKLGLQRLQERAKEWSEESSKKDTYYF